MSADKRWQLRVQHILEAIARIHRYMGGVSEAVFSADEKTVDAVIRNLQVIGEAARHVPEEIQVRYPEIPWIVMQGMRHVLVHDYYAVKLDILWRTVQQDLPPLVDPLKRILNENP